MARTSSSIRVSYPFHAAVDGELRRHAARTGIPTAEIIRRSFDLYEALLYQYKGKIPPEMVQPAVQPDGTAYPNTVKRIPFYIDPYLAHKLKGWEGQEAHLLGYAVLCYIGMWALINPQDAEADMTYVDQTVVQEVDQAPTSAPNGQGAEDDEPIEDEPTEEETAANEAEAVDQQGVASENEDEEEVFTEAEASTEHLDEEGNPTQDVHGNPIGTLYDADGNVTNLDRDGNLINWDEFGYPEGTTYGADGQPNNLDEDGFPVTAQAAA